MGLDSLDLLMSVEQHFGISIPNKEAEGILTINDFTQAVKKRVKHNPNSLCKSQLLFYKLRRYVVNRFGFPHQEFTPQTLINDFLPETNRLQTWSKMSAHFNMKFPPFNRKDFRADDKVGFFKKILLSKESVTDKTVRQLIGWLLD